jgi:hypothetical protein
MISPASAAVAANPKAAATANLVTVFMASPGSFCELMARRGQKGVCASAVRVPPSRSNSRANPSHVGARPTGFCALEEGAARTSDKTLWLLAFNRAVRFAVRAPRTHSVTTSGLCGL